MGAVLASGRVSAEGPKEECGVFAVWAPGDDVARLTYFALFAQQHRGQEAAGMAVSDGEHGLQGRVASQRPGMIVNRSVRLAVP